MENNELSRKYELMVIVDARLGAEEKESIFKEAADLVVKNGGKIINSQIWLEKHKLTFVIKKCKEVTFHLMNYEADGSTNDRIKAALRINERILRFSITYVEKFTLEPVKG